MTVNKKVILAAELISAFVFGVKCIFVNTSYIQLNFLYYISIFFLRKTLVHESTAGIKMGHCGIL